MPVEIDYEKWDAFLADDSKNKNDSETKEHVIAIIQYDEEFGGYGHETLETLQVEGSESKILSVYEYVPIPGNKYTYNNNYAFEEGYDIQTVWVGRINTLLDGSYPKVNNDFNNEILASAITYLNEKPILVTSYVKAKEGLTKFYEAYGVPDIQLDLPYDYEVGKNWQDVFGRYEIIETGASVTVSGMYFENCIVKYSYFTESGFAMYEYICPGYSLVYSQYANETDYFELINIEKIDPDKANSLIKEFAVKK